MQGERITCRECHRLGKKITNEDCQECHDAKWFSTKGKFYEQSHKAVTKRPCLECHVEHKGYDVPISLPFGEQEHKTIPMPGREKCIDCHLSQAKTVHPNSINFECKECHEYGQWERGAMDHVSIKPKTVSISAPYNYCLKCHSPGYHYIDLAYPDPISQCKPCHRKKEARPEVLPPGY